jgi:actin-related protein 10
MPLYEGIGLINEKPAVVVDIGYAYTKIGFAGEVCPHAVIPSFVTCARTQVLKSLLSDWDSNKDFYHAVQEFFRDMFFKLLLVNPKERAVVYVESLVGSGKLKAMVARVLFLAFEVPSLAIVPGHVVSVFPSMGALTALVLDVGHTAATILAVSHGVSFVKALRVEQLGAFRINEKLREDLLAHGYLVKSQGVESPLKDSDLVLDEADLNAIRVKTCFVTTLDRVLARKEGKIEKECDDVIYHLKRGNKVYSIRVPGIVRETAADVLFEPDEDGVSLPSLILDSILKCPIDLRKAMAENLLVCGGTVNTPGFHRRLGHELRHISETHPFYKERLFAKNFTFSRLCGLPENLFWFGGSVLGSTQQLSWQGITRENYLVGGFLPEWCDLRYTVSPNPRKSLKA